MRFLVVTVRYFQCAWHVCKHRGVELTHLLRRRRLLAVANARIALPSPLPELARFLLQCSRPCCEQVLISPVHRYLRPCLIREFLSTELIRLPLRLSLHFLIIPLNAPLVDLEQPRMKREERW